MGLKHRAAQARYGQMHIQLAVALKGFAQRAGGDHVLRIFCPDNKAMHLFGRIVAKLFNEKLGIAGDQIRAPACRQND